MKYKWLTQNYKNDNLIYFFNGWGMDESVLNILKKPLNTDILMFYDYQNLEINNDVFDECLKYKNKYLISWSMGVMISTIRPPFRLKAEASPNLSPLCFIL